MIPVTRMNNQRIHLNPDLIESVEESGDTVLILTNGHRLVVRESAEEVVRRVIEYRRALLSAATQAAGGGGARCAAVAGARADVAGKGEE
jgi:flagellar protein FlbD